MDEQNIYDNPVFFRNYTSLRKSELNYNTLLEQPAMAELLPDLTGRRVLDLGCGCGQNCFQFAELGAEKVIGVDISERMLAVARREAAHPKITYYRRSMSDLSGFKGPFDLVYSSLAFHYVENFERLIKECSRLLSPGGELLFSQEHPIVTATKDYGGHFNCDASGKEVSFTFSDYGCSGKRENFWFVDGVMSYHRTMGEILTTVARAGFRIEVVCEPTPKKWATEKMPALEKEWIKPIFLLVRARKEMDFSLDK